MTWDEMIEAARDEMARMDAMLLAGNLAGAAWARTAAARYYRDAGLDVMADWIEDIGS